MPASLTRTEYYWSNNRLVQEINSRANVYSRWHLLGQKHDLVATIEDRGTAKKIELGPAATPLRTVHSLLRDERLHADPTTRDIGADVPDELIRHGAAIVKNAVGEITKQYSRLSNEERKTGALQFDLNRHSVLEHDGWQLTIILQGFAANPKEKRTGADVGIIIDVRHGGMQVSKALWAQAKQADSMPEDPWTLQDFEGQMRSMLERTKDAYGVVYTPNGTAVYHGWDSKRIMGLPEVISDVVACRRGDRRPEFLADTIHRDFLVEMVFESTAPDRSPPAHIELGKAGF